MFKVMTFGIQMFGTMTVRVETLEFKCKILRVKTFGIQMFGIMTFGNQMFAVMTVRIKSLE